MDADTRRNIVFSQILVLTLFGLAIHFIGDMWRGDYGVVFFVVLTAIVTGFCFFLNEHRHHSVARYTFFALLNVIFFTLAALVPRTCAINLLILALMGVSLVVYGQKDFITGLTFAGIGLLCLVILEVTNYHPFGDYRILEASSLYNSIINVTSAGVTLTLSIVFQVYQNHISELGLLKQQEQLGRTNAKLDRVLYSASHDLRAPLNSIKGLINIASKEDNPRVLKEYFGLVEDRIAKLDNFILDILEFSKSEKAVIAHENFSIRDLVNEVANNLRYMDGASKISLIQEFGDVDFVHTDPKRLSVILNNLIGNAIKYRHQSREQSWVKIHAQQLGKKLTLVIQDNGIGISEEHQPRVFDMFYRATPQQSGSGLGLFLVKEAVDQLDGKIALQSNYGKGSTFIISLPLN